MRTTVPALAFAALSFAAAPGAHVGAGGVRMLLARLLAWLLCASMLATCSGSRDVATRTQMVAPAAPREVPGVQLPSFVNLVKQEGPAVVNISASHTIRGGVRELPGLQDDPFFEF